MNTVTTCRDFLPTVKRPKAFSPRSLSAACHASGCSCLTPVACACPGTARNSNAVLKDGLVDGTSGGLLGATVGATKGADDCINTDADIEEGGLSDLVRDAIANKQTVLVVLAQTELDAATAREVMQASVGDYKETAPVDQGRPVGPM